MRYTKLLIPLFIFLMCGALVMGGCTTTIDRTVTVVQPLQPVYVFVPYAVPEDEGCGEVAAVDCWYEPDDGPGET